MKKLLILIISLFVIQTSSAQTFKELQVIPHDSTNAEQMKIWFPVKAKMCDVHLRILDSKRKLVRDLLHRKIKQGYYNVYWDKKDDSGNFVDEGKYSLATISCDYKRLTPIKVKYSNGEDAVLFTPNDDEFKPSLHMQILKDSIRVSVEIENIRNRQSAILFSDSLITGKDVTLNWNPSDVTPNGKYYYKVKVDDFEQLIPFTYRKNAR